MNLVEATDTFLRLCEERRLQEASEYLAPDATLVFPGGVEFTTLEDMVAASRGRYQWLEKRRDTYLEGTRTDDARPVVVSMGTLSGVSASGESFADVRYADVMVFRDGRIVEQLVYNDLAELGHV